MTLTARWRALPVGVGLTPAAAGRILLGHTPARAAKGEDMEEKKDEKLEIIVKSIRRTRNNYILGFLFIFGFGVFLTVLSILDPEEAGTAGLVMGIVIAVFGLLVGLVIIPILNPRTCPLMKLLTEHPDKIVWLCTMDVPGARGRPQKNKKSVIVHDADRKGHTFNVKTDQLEEVMSILQSIAPRATVGFTKENNEKYKADPYSLLKDADSAPKES